MTKTLTEQWKNGELPEGYYYIRSANNKECIDINDNWKFKSSLDCGTRLFHKEVKEVLAPVPSYDEWQESQKKRALWFEEKGKIRNRLENKIKLLEEGLNYALETMGQIAKLSNNTVDSVQCAHAICVINERLKEMEGVK